jgi:DNA primase
MSTVQRPSIADFYEHEVLPALMSRLDQAFPEFGWRRDARGWVATSADYTRSTLGARPDRVVCHGDAPRGFLIHGQGAVLWTTYFNDGQPARGRDFVSAVRGLSERAGVDASILDRAPSAAERRGSLLEEAFVVARRELASEHGSEARSYLEQRGIQADRTMHVELGVMPSHDRLRLALLGVGYTTSEIDASHLLSDDRWPGRILGAWRDEHQHVRTLWARSTDADDQTRYLYLRGLPSSSDLPYGLSNLLASRNRTDRRELLLVEGVLDVHVLRSHDISNVAALGGSTASRGLFDRLHTLGVERAVLAFDNDAAGRLATSRAIDAAVRSEQTPDLWVIDPDLLAPNKDPGELIQSAGVERWHATTAAPAAAVTWRALDLTGPLDQQQSELARRTALDRASKWLGALPSRLALEQAQALDVVADTLGYDRHAVDRTFRARYWQREPHQDASRGFSQTGR